MLEGDVIECVQTFKYLGILLETTSNLDSAMEHLAVASRRSLFVLNCCCAELRIMDVKLHCDLFNTLVHSTTSYAYEVWMDSKKIEAIEVMYRGFLKSLLGVQKTTSMSIVLVEFGKFPFEHFAWGQALLYYNCVSMVTKNYILGKAWEAQLAMLATGKKCWVGSVKKWLFQNQPQKVAGFLPLVQPSLGMAPQLVTTCALWAGIVQLSLGTVPRTMHIHPTHLIEVRGWVESQVPWCNAHNIQVGAQKVEAPPLSGFPHTMLNVKRAKDNMRLTFIKKLFTNHEIKTNV